MSSIVIRDAWETDAEAIIDIFRASYGEEYPYTNFYDARELRKMILSDDSIVIVAEYKETGQVVGTASVLEARGAYSDLVGEFGRLAVLPEARHGGAGNQLMQGRLERVKRRLHVGVVDARITHPFSTRISLRHGFAVVGYVPSKIRIDRRENIVMMAQHFGQALRLRRNHPRIIPEAYELAHLAMDNCGIEFDAIVDEVTPPYPAGGDFDLNEMMLEGYADLLRIERGRVKKREIFGPMRLHYGFFKLQAKNSHYLLAKANGHLVGAIGYLIDDVDAAVRIIELISLNDDVVRVLLESLVERCRDELGMKFIEANVSACSPEMQRTLLELGFVPCAYIPALVFDEVERLDIVKMARVFGPLETDHDVVLDEARTVVDIVRRGFQCRQIPNRVMKAVNHVSIFKGLSFDQCKVIAAYSTLENFKEGEVLFREGNDSTKIYMVLSGNVAIHLQTRKKPVGIVQQGECLGEVSVLSNQPHTATAIASQAVETAAIAASDLEKLIRLRPDIGVVVFRNLATGLGNKLRRSDLAILEP